MEDYLIYSHERGEGLEKFRASSRALRVEPELSLNWRQNAILHISLAEQKSLFRLDRKQGSRLERFIMRRSCQVKSTKPISCSDKGPVWGQWAGMGSSCCCSHGPGHADPSEYCQQRHPTHLVGSHPTAFLQNQGSAKDQQTGPNLQVSTEMQSFI